MTEQTRQSVRVEKQFVQDVVLLTELAEACDEMEKNGVMPQSVEVQDSYESTRYITLIGARPETDVEMQARIKDAEYQRVAGTAFERREYERLKKKFEGGGK